MVNGRLEWREPPPEVVALRTELQKPWNIEIAKAGIEGRNFEECMGHMAAALGIQLNGTYEVPTLCRLLLSELQKRSLTWH